MPQRKVKTLMNCNVTKVAKLQWIVRLQKLWSHNNLQGYK